MSGRERDIYGERKIVIAYKKVNKELICEYFDLTKYNSIEELDQELNRVESDFQKKIIYNKILNYITKSKIYIPEKNPNLVKNQSCIRISSQDEMDLYGNSKLVISFKHFCGVIFNFRFDVTALQSIEEYDNLLNAKLEEFRNYTK